MVQTLMERRVEEAFERLMAGGRIRNGTPGNAYTYLLKDADGNEINRAVYSPDNVASVVGMEIDGTVIASYELLQNIDELKAERRMEREEVFAETLDKMNPIWYSQLSETQLAELEVWRQAWLDYPDTGIKPDMLSYLQ